MRILYIEDDPISIRVIQRITNYLADELLIASTVADGIIMAMNNPDLVLLDLNLPDGKGLDVARRIRELGYTFPVVALTAGNIGSDYQRCLDAGCNDYVVKPVNFSQMCSYLNKWFGR